MGITAVQNGEEVLFDLLSVDHNIGNHLKILQIILKSFNIDPLIFEVDEYTTGTGTEIKGYMSWYRFMYQFHPTIDEDIIQHLNLGYDIVSNKITELSESLSRDPEEIMKEYQVYSLLHVLLNEKTKEKPDVEKIMKRLKMNNYFLDISTTLLHWKKTFDDLFVRKLQAFFL